MICNRASIRTGVTLGALGALIAAAVAGGPAHADPCGIVPPIAIDASNPALTRIGVQTTYVFHKDGIEDIVLRPAFRGRVQEFGMLIPFPEPPAIRKMPDDVFTQVKHAIDPPKVHLYGWGRRGGRFDDGRERESATRTLGLARDKVEVLREEAVGMYQIAVLDAGSAEALQKWMTAHGYVYPEGMDAPCEDYVEAGWCFVAVKAKVGKKSGAEPRPGMRKVDTSHSQPFDGAVQAMGFRFRAEKPVVPMRLSAFNAGELDNLVYILAAGSRRFAELPREMVVRRIPGRDLLRNVTGPRPIADWRDAYGDDAWKQLTEEQQKQQDVQHAQQVAQWRKNNAEWVEAQLDPAPVNGKARLLFADDILAAQEGRLIHPHEQREKDLLAIGETFGLRGAQIDTLHAQAISAEREKAVDGVLEWLDGMTMTVIRGDFPREILAEKNLHIVAYGAAVPGEKHGRANPSPSNDGVEHARATPTEREPIVNEPQMTEQQQQENGGLGGLAVAGALLALGGGLVLAARRRRGWIPFVAAIAIAVAIPTIAVAEPTPDDAADLVEKLGGQSPDEAIEALVKMGEKAVPHLIGEAFEGTDLVRRGWAIVCLARIGGDDVEKRLTELHGDDGKPALVRTWAAAARVDMAEGADELVALASLIPHFPALDRPIAQRIVALQKAEGSKVTVAQLIDISTRIPQLQSALAQPIIGSGTKELAKVTLTGADNRIRRQAAAYLATALGSAEDPTEAQADAASIYAYDVEATDISWKGGALFVPGLNWKKEPAKKLVRNLIAWYVYCDRTGKAGEKNQIQNNLRSINLANAIGVERQAWFQAQDARSWVALWVKIAGKDSAKAILKEQGLADDPEWTKALGQ